MTADVREISERVLAEHADVHGRPNGECITAAPGKVYPCREYALAEAVLAMLPVEGQS